MNNEMRTIQAECSLLVVQRGVPDFLVPPLGVFADGSKIFRSEIRDHEPSA